MKYKLKLKTRLLLLLLSTSLIIFAAGIGYISYRFKNKSMADAKEIAQSSAREYANLIKSQIDKEFGVSRGMAVAMKAIENSNSPQREQLQFDILHDVLVQNPSYIASFLQWDLSDCDSTYNKYHGRRRYLCYRKYPQPEITGILKNKDYGIIETMKGIIETESFDYNNPFYICKRTLNEYIIDPYFYSYNTVYEMPSEFATQKDAILETTIIVPIVENNKFRAVVGVDIPLNHFRNIIKKIKPFNKSHAFIISNNGEVVAHHNVFLLARQFTDYIPKLDFDINNKISNGHEFSFIIDDPYKGEQLFMFCPIEIAKTKTPWAIAISVPINVIIGEAEKNFYISLLVGFFGLLIFTLIIYRIAKSITRPIEKTTVFLNELSEGKFDTTEQIIVNTGDEIQAMATSANILLDGLKQTTQFAKSIGDGKLETEYSLLSENDILGHSLIDMRNKLKQSKDEIQTKNRELEKLSMAVQKTDNAVMIMDNVGNIEWVNNAFEKMYGYTLENFQNELGRNMIQLSTHTHIKQIIDKCINNHTSIYYDSMIRSKKGESIYAQTTITPVIDENGNVSKLLAIDSNITEIIKAQDKIKNQRDQLENLNATKDRFFAIISHDLKNPFASLLSLSQSLSENLKDFEADELEQFLKRVNKSAWQIYDLLENLLTWSRSQTGKLDFEAQKVNVAQSLNTTYNLLLATAQKKQIDFSVSCNNDINMYVDNNMMMTVLRNLTHNALKFTNREGKVKISANKIDENNIEFIVEDNGIGLNDVDKEKLFRIDVKTKAIGKSKEKGTGLGLILCKEFIQKNGGDIRIESEENKGSKFIFNVPSCNTNDE